MSMTETKPVPVDELSLDPENPRLVERGFTIDDQDNILKVLWQERAVNEIVNSIAASGYWQQEVLFAAEEKGQLVVVEGNRRLSAVKLLLSKELREKIGATGIPIISESKRKDLRTLPVIMCTRQSLWQYVGFKHVNGPQDWDSIAKAEYVASVHKEYGVSLEKIAETIGDDNLTVKRLYRGLMVLQQAETAAGFDHKDSWKKKFPYSHLWTGLGYQGIQEFLEINPDDWTNSNPVPRKRITQLGELCLWLFGSREQGIRPVVLSQNPDLRILDEVLKSKNGYVALRSKLPLSVALKVSRGDEALLREALVVAEQALRESMGYIPTGYDGATDLLEKAKDIEKLAHAIREEMGKRSAVSDEGRPVARLKKEARDAH
jgi:hypothetical protein